MSNVSSSSSYTTPSGMTGAGGGNMLRITGMATGLDVDAMVKKMMAAEQTKLDKAKQQQQTIQWRQDAYQSIIKDIKDLQSSFFDSGSSDKNILSSTNFAPFNVSGVGGAALDTSVATFTPGVGTQSGQYSIAVKQLAAGAGISNSLSGKTLSTKLSDMGLNGNISLVLNVNGASSDITVTLDNSGGTKTIGDLVSSINNQAGASVKASFSELTGKFNLSTVVTGETTSLTIKSGTTIALSNIIGSGTGAFGADANLDGITDVNGTAQANGTNVDVTITPPGSTDGIHVTDKTNNNFTIDGMNYSLSSISPTNAGVPIATTVNVGTDTQKVYDKIKGFIDKYNTIVDEIQTKLTEKKDINYKPLTDAQKASMSDSQITAWETKAKVGILRNDDNLQNLLNELRSAFNTGVSDTSLSLGKYGNNSFGIDSADFSNLTNPNHIFIVDESKLKAAIASKSDQILKMFTNVSSKTDADDSKTYDNTKIQYQEDGVFTRISKILQTNVGYTNTTFNSAVLTSYANTQYDYSSTGGAGQNTLPDQLYEQQLMIKKLTDSMNTKQEAYYQQFSQLETAMNQFNAQQSMLSSMISG